MKPVSDSTPPEITPTDAENHARDQPMRERAWRRLLSTRSRRLFLQVGLPWAAALLVGLVSVLYAD